jgi:hypothetical protein
MWGLGGLLAVAVATAAVLILARMRSGDHQPPARTVVVGLLALVAIAASLAVATSSTSARYLGTPRRYADYLQVPSGWTFSGPTVSVSNAWFGAATVAVVLLAAVMARGRRPLTARRRRRST